ncbi:MAG: hypothetical protein AAB262_13800, partial [Elusimicrobiota bacterium]
TAFGAACPSWRTAAIYQTSWTYTSGALVFTGGHHYVVTSSGTDLVGNVQLSTTPSRFLYDSTAPVAGINSGGAGSLVNGQTYLPGMTFRGTDSDEGFTAGIEGGGCGVRNLGAPWHQGRVQTYILRDDDDNAGGGPVPLGTGCTASTDYQWDGSTWTLVTDCAAAARSWVNVTNQEDETNWEQQSVAASTIKWVKGKKYIVYSRAIDNAGNIQQDAAIPSGRKIQIAENAATLVVRVRAATCGAAVTTVVAGNDYCVEVEALDSTMSRALAYSGTVNFTMENLVAPSTGPETMDNNAVVDDDFGLPQSYAFNPATDSGIKTFDLSFRPRRASVFDGLRTFRARDSVVGSITGATDLTVNAATPDRIMVQAQGELYAPGKTSAPKGRVDNAPPTPRLAGDPTSILLRVTDRYWNMISVSTTITLTTSDPYDSETWNPVVFSGSTTVSVAMVQRGTQTVTATGGSWLAPGPSHGANPSSVITVSSAAVDRLLIVLPGETRREGKTAAPAGKEGTPDPWQAGRASTVAVYAVDFKYNNTSAAFEVYVRTPDDSFDVPPSSQSLVSGTTVVSLTLVTAKAQNLAVDTPDMASDGGPKNPYTTPVSFTVYSGSATRIQLLVEGQAADPGNVSAGGRTAAAPATLSAGVTSYVSVNLVDNYYNLVTGPNPFVTAAEATMPEVRVCTTDPYDGDGAANGCPADSSPNWGFAPGVQTLSAGTRSVAVRMAARCTNLYQEGACGGAGWRVRAQDTTGLGTNYGLDDVNNVPVQSTSPVMLQLILPGETQAQGINNATGKSDAIPDNMTAGAPAGVPIVRAVDQFWNRVTGETGRNVRVASNDPYATAYGDLGLSNGQRTFGSFTPKRRGPYNSQHAFDVSPNIPALQLWSVDSDAVKLSTQTSANIAVAAAAPTKLQIILPGQRRDPGSFSGKTGPVTPQAPGVRVTARVHLVDANWNAVDTASPTVRIESDNSASDYVILSSSKVLSAGPGGYESWIGADRIQIFNSTGSTALRAVNMDAPGSAYSDDISSTFTVTAPAASLDRLFVLLPDQNHVPGKWHSPGSNVVANGTAVTFTGVLGGKSGAAFASGTPKAGENFMVRAFATDPYWNPISTDAVTTMTPVKPAGAAGDTTTAQAQAMILGTTDYAFFLRAAKPGWKFQATASNLTAYDSDIFSLDPAAAARLLLLVNGQSEYPGSAAGKTGPITAFTAGTSEVNAFTARVVDNYWNLVSVGVSANYLISTNDPYDGDETGAGLSYEQVKSHTFKTANPAGWTVRVETTTAGGYLADTVSGVIVNPGAGAKLQILAPGEVAVPGSSNGKDMAIAPSISTAGVPFTFTIRTVDADWNPTADNVTVTLGVRGDPYAVWTGGNTASVVGGVATKEVTLKRAQSGANFAVIEATVTAGGAQTSAIVSPATRGITVNANVPTRLQVLIPNQAADPGSGAGYSGTVALATAGISLPVTVNVTDDYWNVRADTSATVRLATPSDPYSYGDGIDQPLFLGTTVFALTFYKGEGAAHTIVASTNSAQSFASAVTPSITVVSSSPAKLLVLLPPESADPGKPPYNDLGALGGGRTAAPYAPPAGTAFQARVYAVDNYWNKINAGANDVAGTTQDPNDNESGLVSRTLTAGTTNLDVRLVSAGSWNISVSTTSGGLLSKGLSSTATVTAGAVTQIVVLLPGESLNPGKGPYAAGGVSVGNVWGGKTSASQADLENWKAGNPVFTSTNVKVQATDGYWNPAASAVSVVLTPADPNAPPQTQTLVGGSTNFTLTLYTAVVSTGTRRAFSANASGFTVYQTTSVLVLPNDATKLRVLAPGVARLPGTPAGKTAGPPTDQIAGIPFTVTVDVTDNWGNMTSSQPVACLFTPDDNVDAVGNTCAAGRTTPLSDSGSGGTTTFQLILNTERTDDILAGEIATTPSTSTVVAALASALLSSDQLGIEVDDDEACTAGACKLLMFISPQTYGGGV